MNTENKETEKQFAIHVVMWRFIKTWWKLPIGIIIGLNLGKLLGIAIAKFLIWTGLLTYLETFFGWFVWV